MKKDFQYALAKAIICLLKINQGHSDMSTNFYIARDNYIEKTVRLLEEALEQEQKRGWFK